jgi:hypothetical protein
MRHALFACLVRLAPRPSVAAAASVALATAITSFGGDAAAKSSFESTYGYERTWNAALRLVRVDLGLKVTEKDEQNGYLIFEYKSPDTGGKLTTGSIELVRSREASQPVQVMVQLAEQPRYHEQVMLDTLARKMRQEYGDPPKLPARTPPAPDAGADSGS